MALLIFVAREPRLGCFRTAFSLALVLLKVHKLGITLIVSTP